MADTGWKLPGTAVANRTIAGSDDDWTGADNIKVDDFSNASVTMGAGAESSGLAASNFDFSAIPAGATIDGIEAQVGAYTASLSSVSVAALRLILADNSDGSVSKHADLTFFNTFPTTDEVGGAADLWSETITRANVQDIDWGFFIGVQTSGLGDGGNVDFMQMKVYYTEAGGGGSGPRLAAGRGISRGNFRGAM